MRRVLKQKPLGLLRWFNSEKPKETKTEDDLNSPQPIKNDAYFEPPVDPTPIKPREFTVFITKTSHVIPGRLLLIIQPSP